MSSVEVSVAPPAARLNNQQLAWAIMLGAFTLFCVLCLVTGYGVHYFIFRSTVPLQVALDVARGTAAYVDTDLVEKVVPLERHLVSSNEQVRTDSQSQAALLIRDPYQDNALVAMITVDTDTTATLNFAARPRFEWGAGEYNIELTGVEGNLEIFVSPGLARSLWMSVRRTDGMGVYINQSGRYNLAMSETLVQVDTYVGQALLSDPGLTSPHLVGAGQRGVLSELDDVEQVILSPAPVNLLQDSQIEQLAPAELNGTDRLIADLVHPWQCGSIESTPEGRYRFGTTVGRAAIRLVRGQDADSHGETFCSQLPGPGQTGRDVSIYSYLSLRSTFYIDDHSLSLCGTEGSECPLMLQIDYVYRAGDELLPAQWFHGFYAETSPQLDYPPRCASCIQEHEQVHLQRWYTYNSGNLFALITPERRPEAILRVRFYASGHEYDVYVADVSLLAS